MADVVFIIAETNFRDEELFNTKGELDKLSISCKIASKTAGEKTGKLGGRAVAEIALKDVIVDTYKAVVFVGGPGAEQYFNDEEALNLAKEAHEKNRIVAAICIAPIILANAGILDGKDATVFKTMDNVYYFKKKNINYKERDVVVSGKIITANGPAASREFGQTIARMIKD